MAYHTFVRAKPLKGVPCTVGQALTVVQDLLNNSFSTLSDDVRANVNNLESYLKVLEAFPEDLTDPAAFQRQAATAVAKAKEVGKHPKQLQHGSTELTPVTAAGKAGEAAKRPKKGENAAADGKAAITAAKATDTVKQRQQEAGVAADGKVKGKKKAKVTEPVPAPPSAGPAEGAGEKGGKDGSRKRKTSDAEGSGKGKKIKK